MGDGTLARTSILGSAPRMVEHVREADWNPDGSDLAVVRQMAGYDNPMRAKPTSQQRSQDKRDRILTAMDALLLRTSFAEISVADLAAKAKVVQATIDAARTSAGTPTRNAMPCIFRRRTCHGAAFLLDPSCTLQPSQGRRSRRGEESGLRDRGSTTHAVRARRIGAQSPLPTRKAECHHPPVRSERVAADHRARWIEIALQEMDDCQSQERQGWRTDSSARRKHGVMIRDESTANGTVRGFEKGWIVSFEGIAA